MGLPNAPIMQFLSILRTCLHLSQLLRNTTELSNAAQKPDADKDEAQKVESLMDKLSASIEI